MDKSYWVRVLGIVLVVVLLAVVVFTLPIQDYLQSFFDWMQGWGVWGKIAVTLAYVPLAVLLLPCSILTIGAGMAFGALIGTLMASIGGTLGAAAAFWVGRTIARDWIQGKLSRSERFQALSEAVGRDDFKVVFLTRLSPVFPYNFLNYALAVTPVNFRKYLLATWIGMLPGTFLYAYIGSSFRNLSEVTSGEFEGGTGKTALYVLGLIATVAVTVIVTRRSQRILRERIAHNQEPDSSPAVTSQT